MWLCGIEIYIGRQKYHLYCLYHSPSSSDIEFLNVLDDFLEDINLDGTFIVIGDFNINLDSNSFYAGKLNEIINKYGLYQLVDSCTRITIQSSTKIDLILTNDKEIQHKVLKTPKITDHSIIEVYLDGKQNNESKIIKYRNYTNMDVMAYQLYLMNMRWTTNSSNINTLADDLVQGLISALNEFAPLQEKIIKESWGGKLWWNHEIEEQMKTRDQLYQRAAITHNEEDWRNFRVQRNTVVSLIRNAKIKYYDEKIDSVKNNSTEMWKTLKKIISSKSHENVKGEILFDDKMISGLQICEKFNEFFLDSIRDISKNITPNKSFQETVQPIENEHQMEKFRKIEMAELRKILKRMENKESSTDGITVKLLKDAFEAIGDKFLNVINQSLEQGKFPEKWKKSTIVPSEKKKGTIRCEEFRPINMVPPYEKLLERCVNDQIMDYVERNGLLSECQAGFRGKNSCESALQTVLFDWKSALENKKIIGVVFLDFKRAFETINRKLLLLKLQKYGFGQVISHWFEEYLNGRTQVTKYIETSKKGESVFGVPQGTVLGPSLFILYINDMVKSVQNCKIQHFADDTILYITGENIDEIIDIMNNELNNVFQWLNNNYLHLNVNKTKAMFIRNKNNKLDINANLNINNESLEVVNSFRYLGCVIDNHLTFSEHYKYITNKMAKKINMLGRISKNLSSWAKLTIYKTIVAPHLYFCSTLLFLMNNWEIDNLQKLQNKALRIILGCSKYTRRTDMLNMTNILSVRQTVTLNTMLFIYKMIHQLVPQHLLNNCRFVKDVHEHNTRTRDHFYLDRVSTTFGQNCLFYKGLRQYNELPVSVKNCDNLISFKKGCIKYIKHTIEI